jgi:hypothetical protein
VNRKFQNTRLTIISTVHNIFDLTAVVKILLNVFCVHKWIIVLLYIDFKWSSNFSCGPLSLALL